MDPFDPEERDDADAMPRFKVTGAGEASIAMRMVKKIRAQMDDAKATRDAEIATVTEWFNDRMAKLASQLAFVEMQLTSYIQMRRQDIPDFTINSPSGTAYLRDESESIEWTDEQAVLDFAVEHKHDSIIKTRTSLDKNAAKKLFRPAGEVMVNDDGEVVPGIVIRKNGPRLVVKLTIDQAKADAA